MYKRSELAHGTELPCPTPEDLADIRYLQRRTQHHEQLPVQQTVSRWYGHMDRQQAQDNWRLRCGPWGM